MDYYTKDPRRLNARPKYTLAQYVESQGFPVPRRFSTIKGAQDSGLDILVRSEHPQDYDGESGIATSFRLRDEVDSSEIVERVTGEFSFHVYCYFTKRDPKKFAKEWTYSLWEELKGDNITIVADSSVPHRYHLSVRMPNPQAFNAYIGRDNYSLIENGKIILSAGKPLTSELQAALPQLLRLYEQIRSLEHFDPLHCPIMELQHEKGIFFFLQYHRTRDFQTPQPLNPPGFQGSSACFVRGATKPKTYKVTVVKADVACKDPDGAVGHNYSRWHVPRWEQAAFSIMSVTTLYDEVMARRRQLQIIEANNQETILETIAGDHMSRSQMFKPQISLIVPKRKLVDDEELVRMTRRARLTRQDQSIYVTVASDGRQAYLKRERPLRARMFPNVW